MKRNFVMPVGAVVLAALCVSVFGCKQGTANAAGDPGSAAGTAASDVSGSGTQKVEADDPKYGMQALTMTIPSGWKYAGTVVRAAGCHAAGADIAYTALSQDGVTALVRLPGVTWTWTNSPSMLKIMAGQGCPAIDINTSASFLVNIAVPNLHPGAKIAAMLPLLPAGQATVTQQLAQLQQNNATAPKQFQQQNITLEGSRARVQYVRNGKPVEEMISAVISCYETITPQLFASGEPASTRRVCTSRGTNITRAPQGNLDAVLAQPQVSAVGGSVVFNPQWQARLQQDQQAAFQAGLAANNRQFQTFMANNRAQNAQMLANGRAQDAARAQGTANAMAADRATQAGIDAAAHNTVNYSLGTQDFTNPNTGQTINASSDYNHQWVSSDGSTLIQTNNPSLDPNGQVYPVSQSWTELVPK
jgi:hypothetical protein